MSTFKIVIDRSLLRPSRFSANLNEGIADAVVAESDDPAVLDAAASCPMGAIAVYEAETLEQAA